MNVKQVSGTGAKDPTHFSDVFKRMTPAVNVRPLRRRTIALCAASLSIAGAAALLHARAPDATKVTPKVACGDPGATVGGVAFAVRPESCKLLRGATETHLAVEISGPRGDSQRDPVAMALVIDRSGSMLHKKLADAQAAATRAIDALGDNDEFSLVSFSSDVQLLLPLGPASETRKSQARAAIAAMTADGDTNLSAGLEMGAATLREEGGAHVERVVLISDGDPDEGLITVDDLSGLATRLAQGGASITTIGVGLEFQEQKMTAMAVAGRGNYYFVENTDDLASIFGRELDSLGDTVAVDARLELTPAPGVSIEDAYGYRVTRDGGVVRVPIADLRAGEARKVVVDLRVDATAPGAMDLVKARLVWRPVGEHQERFVDQQVSVAISDDAAQVAASQDGIAVRGVQEAELAKAVDQATEAYQNGDADKAKEILQTQATKGAAAAAVIGDGELKQTIDRVHREADDAFAAPPSSGAGASRAQKNARDMAYHLAR